MVDASSVFQDVWDESYVLTGKSLTARGWGPMDPYILALR